MLYGYGPLILKGTWMTLQLALLSLGVALSLGLAGATARFSRHSILHWLSVAYTTLIRSVPDLLTMLLLFYSLQIGLNQLTDWMGISQIDIDPFAAGVTTLGIIYGAYFTETFRGAFQAVPHGQLEAAKAYGMTGWQAFHRILFPQMMRFAIPGIANNWQVMIKATALVSIIGLPDVVQATQDAGKGSLHLFFFSLVAAGIYLGITTVSALILATLSHKYSVGVRKAIL